MSDRPPIVQSFRRDSPQAEEPRRGVVGLVVGGLAFGAIAALCGFLIYMELDPDRRDRMRDWPVVGPMLAIVDPVPPEPPPRVVYRRDPAAEAGPDGSRRVAPVPSPAASPPTAPGPGSLLELARALVPVPDRPAAAPVAMEGVPGDPALNEAIGRVLKALPVAIAHIQEERSAEGYRALEEVLVDLPPGFRPPPVIEALAWMGIALFDLGRDSEGERLLEDLAARHGSTRAIGELARHYYDIDRFDRAEFHLGRLNASRVEGTRAADYLKQVSVMKRITGVYALAEAEHCRVRYPPALGAAAGREAVAACEATWADVQGRLSLPLTRRKMPIVVLPRAMANEFSDRKKWSIGFFSNRAFVLLDEGRHEDLRSTVRHEVVHGMLHRACVWGLPAWLNEGLAVSFEDAGWRTRSIAALEEGIAAGRVRPVHASEFAARMADAEETAEVAPLYLQAGSIAGYLFRRHGNAAVRQVLLDVRAKKGSDVALRSAVGTDARGLFARWQDDLERRAGRADALTAGGVSPRPRSPRRRPATASPRRRSRAA
jgi:hypothetical protein